MTQTEIQTEVQDQFQPETQADIPAAHQAAVQRAIEIALEAVKRDYSLRPPRSDEDRANGFADWLTRQRQKQEPMMREAVSATFADDAPLDEATTQRYIECCVWPEVEEWLEDYALGYYAGAWVRGHYGDAIYTSPSERFGALWRVPLGVNGYGKNMGQIVLDNEGNVIEDLTTTRLEILEKLRDRKFSPAETITHW